MNSKNYQQQHRRQSRFLIQKGKMHLWTSKDLKISIFLFIYSFLCSASFRFHLIFERLITHSFQCIPLHSFANRQLDNFIISNIKKCCSKATIWSPQHLTDLFFIFLCNDKKQKNWHLPCRQKRLPLRLPQRAIISLFFSSRQRQGDFRRSHTRRAKNIRGTHKNIRL